MTPDHESIGTTEDMDSGNTDDEGTITDEHISPRVGTGSIWTVGILMTK